MQSTILALLATVLLAQFPSGQWTPTRIGTIVVKNATPYPAWVEMRDGGQHLLLRASFCLMPGEGKDYETFSRAGVNSIQLKFEVTAAIRPNGCQAQTLRSVATSSLNVANYYTPWSSYEKVTITKKVHDVFIEGHTPQTFSIRVVTK